MNVQSISNKTVAEIVSEDYRTARVFTKKGIDFCCNGDKLLKEACEEKGISMQFIFTEISAASQGKSNLDNDFNRWPLDMLTEVIEKRHHKYIEDMIPIIRGLFKKVCEAHTQQMPELETLKDLFDDSADELTLHTKKEELLLFPFIRKMVETELIDGQLNIVENTLVSPIKKFIEDHTEEGNRFLKIRTLTNEYKAPQWACTSLKLLFEMLHAFEEDLHLHIHLENNILFPKAIKLERKLKMSHKLNM